MKKLVSVLLVILTVFSLAGAGLAATPTFPDITDGAVAENVAVLQMLGVINGDGGQYYPAASLTRAQFCKMAIVVMGKEELEPLYRGKTIFPDVRGGHWARGYINLAVSGEERIISGYTDGSFRPDDAITYAQAVTILMRVLGYTDADAGMLWPQGYLDLAARVRLTDGMSGLAAGDRITRAAAARLFCNLLTSQKKEGGGYMAGRAALGTDNVVIMDFDVEAPDGSSGGILTSVGVVKSESGVAPEIFRGKRGTLYRDEDGLAMTFIPGRAESRTVIAMSANAGWIRDAAGRQTDIPPNTPVYTVSGETTFAEVFVDIAPGTAVTVYYTLDGKVDAVYLNAGKADAALVVTGAADRAMFSALTGGETDYAVYKDGVATPFSEIERYDVVTYDRASRVMSVSDFRLTGYYENAWPNNAYPTRVKLFGREFDVLPSAVPSLAAFEIGEVITLLLTADFQVAGAVSPNTARGTAIGIVKEGASSGSAAVTLLNGVELSGRLGIAEAAAQALSGELVQVSSPRAGQLSLTRLYGSAAPGAFDVDGMTLQGLAVKQSVKVFERAGASAVARLTLAELAQRRIPASRILYYGKDGAGRVDTLILDDVTGDRYVYGFLTGGTIDVGSFDGSDTPNPAVAVVNSAHTGGTALAIYPQTLPRYRNGDPGGLAVSTDGSKAVALVTLTQVENVPHSAFKTDGERTTVTVDGMVIPVAANVQCYNRQVRTWFASLYDARAFAETLTVCYDRPPEEGGKVRMVIAG